MFQFSVFLNLRHAKIWLSQLKIRRKKCKKRYLNGKFVYEYDQYSMGFPSYYHESIVPLLKLDYEMYLVVENKNIYIALEPRENVSVPRKNRTRTKKKK